MFSFYSSFVLSLPFFCCNFDTTSLSDLFVGRLRFLNFFILSNHRSSLFLFRCCTDICCRFDYIMGRGRISEKMAVKFFRQMVCLYVFELHRHVHHSTPHAFLILSFKSSLYSHVSLITIPLFPYAPLHNIP